MDKKSVKIYITNLNFEVKDNNFFFHFFTLKFSMIITEINLIIEIGDGLFSLNKNEYINYSMKEIINDITRLNLQVAENSGVIINISDKKNFEKFNDIKSFEVIAYLNISFHSIVEINKNFYSIKKIIFYDFNKDFERIYVQLLATNDYYMYLIEDILKNEQSMLLSKYQQYLIDKNIKSDNIYPYKFLLIKINDID